MILLEVRTYLIVLFLFLTTSLFSQEKGLASYYHKRFEGRKTASGHIYRGEDMTCAHRTHPFGTKLRVVNPSNGKKVWVKVVDRGPHVKRRIIDLSYRAALQLDIVRTGVAKVEVYVVNDSIDNLPILPFKVDYLTIKDPKNNLVLPSVKFDIKRFSHKK